MSELRNPLLTRLPLALFPLITTAYAVVVALSYHAPYWHTFGVNIFEFATVADIVRMMLAPVALTLLSVLAGALVGGIAAATHDSLDSQRAEASTRIRARSKTVLYVNAISALIAVVGFPILLYAGRPERFLILLGLAPMLMKWPARGANWLFPNANSVFPAMMSTALAMLPLACAATAATRAERIASGHQQSAVRLVNARSWNASSLSYLGRTSEATFFLARDSREVLIIPAEDVGPFYLLGEGSR